jgi:3-isopropylmalate dehydratase small subunit
MSIFIGVLLLIIFSALSLTLFFIMLWAKGWPKVKIRILNESIEEFKYNEKTFYLPTISYEYEYNGTKFNSNNLSLFGSKRFSSREDANEHLGFDNAFVCPIAPNFSYIYQSSALRVGFVILFFISMTISVVAILIS